jgi:hypothetical protein
VLEKNGSAVPAEELQYRDTINIPYWSGKASDPYPSVKLRMDFSGDIVGFFVYHCHILEHEDKGMMAMIQVLPSASVVSNTVQTVWNPVSIGTTAALIAVVVILLLLVLYLNRTAIYSCFAPNTGKNMSKIDPSLDIPGTVLVEAPIALTVSSDEAPNEVIVSPVEVPASPSTAEAPKVPSVTSPDNLVPSTSAEVI